MAAIVHAWLPAPTIEPGEPRWQWLLRFSMSGLAMDMV